MPKQFVVLVIVMTVVFVAIGFIAIQPENFTAGDNNKQQAATEPAAKKSVTQTNDTKADKPEFETGITVGKWLPEFALADLQGKETRVKGEEQPLILNFWATWCPPCRQEMPELEKFSRMYSGKVKLYVINVQETNEKIAEFMNQNQYTMKVLIDKDGAVAKKFHVTGIPTTLVVDKQGIIKYRKTGPVTLAELEGVLNGL